MERSQSRLAVKPAAASVLRRAAANVIDAALALLLACLLAGSTGRWFAARAVDALRIGLPDSAWTGGMPMLLGALGTIVYGLPLAAFMILLSEPLTGSTPGQRAAGVHTTGSVRSSRERFLLKSSGAWLLVLGLASGSWTVLRLTALPAAIVLIGMIPALFGAPALHDILSKTRMVNSD